MHQSMQQSEQFILLIPKVKASIKLLNYVHKYNYMNMKSDLHCFDDCHTLLLDSSEICSHN